MQLRAHHKAGNQASKAASGSQHLAICLGTLCVAVPAASTTAQYKDLLTAKLPGGAGPAAPAV